MRKILFSGNKNIISQKLRQLRTASGLSQGQLAAQMQTMSINMDQQMISKIERNCRIVTDYELCCLAKILNVEVGALLGDFFKEQ